MKGGAPNLHVMPLPFLAEYSKKQVSPINPSCTPLEISLLSKIKFICNILLTIKKPKYAIGGNYTVSEYQYHQFLSSAEVYPVVW